MRRLRAKAHAELPSPLSRGNTQEREDCPRIRCGGALSNERYSGLLRLLDRQATEGFLHVVRYLWLRLQFGIVWLLAVFWTASHHLASSVIILRFTCVNSSHPPSVGQGLGLTSIRFKKCLSLRQDANVGTLNRPSRQVSRARGSLHAQGEHSVQALVNRERQAI